MLQTRLYYSRCLPSSSLLIQPGERDQGVPKGHDPCHPDSVRSGPLLARPAG